MQRITPPRAVARALLLLAIALAPLSAQTATGGVTGKVTERGTDRPLGEARVVVTGTAVVVYTNAQGEYRVPAVPAGVRQVTAYKVGFQAANAPCA